MELPLLRPKDYGALAARFWRPAATPAVPVTSRLISAASALKARILNELVSLDPEPAQMEAALEPIITLLGEPSGPTRAVAVSVLEECKQPVRRRQFVEVAAGPGRAGGTYTTEGRRRGRKNRQFLRRQLRSTGSD